MKSIDYKAGFNIIVNIYVMRYVYGRMKNTRSQEFNNMEEPGFHNAVLHFSRQRMSRIIDGISFRFSKEERERIVNETGLDEKLFVARGSFLELKGIEEDDWKAYFMDEGKKKSNSIIRFNRVSDEKNRIEKVSKALRELPDIIETAYEPESNIYKLYYYYKNHEKYDPRNRMSTIFERLDAISFEEWNHLNPETLKKYESVIKKQEKMISTILNYKELEYL